MEAIKHFVTECFPSMANEQLAKLMDLFAELGVEEINDLKILEADDFRGVLKIVQARQLKKKIDETFNEDASAREIQTNSKETVNESEINDTVDLQDLQYRFPKKLLTKFEKNERPTPKERREAVRIIVSEVMERIPAPRKRHLEPVASNLVKKYPGSFSDTIGSDVIGMGYSSLLCQLITKVDNDRRDIKKQVKRPSVISAGGITKKKTLADIYGCTNFQPELPLEETEESQKIKQDFMKTSEADKDMSLVRQYMRSTFASQRLSINKGVSVSNILSEWPYLCKREFIFSHIELLMGFSITKKMEECIEKKLPEMEKFFEGKKDLHLNYLHVLTEHFDENIDVCLKIYEEDKTLKEIKEEVPLTPFIACIGNPFTLEGRCTVLIEKENLELLIPLNDALMIWFGSFYIFNLVYPKECCATLEFIQRAFYGINPDCKGSKMEKRFGKRVNIHPKVLKLLNKIKDCNSQWHV